MFPPDLANGDGAVDVGDTPILGLGSLTVDVVLLDIVCNCKIDLNKKVVSTILNRGCGVWILIDTF
jgi:hypothetical protein